MTAAAATKQENVVRIPRIAAGIITTVLSTALIGVFVFLIRINSESSSWRMAENERKRQWEEINESLKGISGDVKAISLDVKTIQTTDLPSLRERMARIEENLKRNNK